MSRSLSPSDVRRKAARAEAKSARLRQNIEDVEASAHARMMVRDGHTVTPDGGFVRDGLLHPNLVERYTTDTVQGLEERREIGEFQDRANSVAYYGRTAQYRKDR